MVMVVAGGSSSTQVARFWGAYNCQRAVHRLMHPKHCAGIQEKASQILALQKLEMTLGRQVLMLKRVGYQCWEKGERKGR